MWGGIRKRRVERSFVPELIHNSSGVGSHLQAVDVDKDGALDLVTSTNRGTFIFWNKMPAAKRG